MTYTDKLRDPRWQQKRLRIMERDKWACVLCGDHEHTLNVHHAIYLPGKEPWEYDDAFLLTLCEQCHGGVEEDCAKLLEWVRQFVRSAFIQTFYWREPTDIIPGLDAIAAGILKVWRDSPAIQDYTLYSYRPRKAHCSDHALSLHARREVLTTIFGMIHHGDKDLMELVSRRHADYVASDLALVKDEGPDDKAPQE